MGGNDPDCVGGCSKEEEENTWALREVCAARSWEEYFWEGPKMRVPPCSLLPLAGT
jgi:hypothetical protein